MLAHVVGRNISIAPIALKNWDLVLWLSTGWFIFVWVFCLVVFFFLLCDELDSIKESTFKCVLSKDPG